ncbi:MAG TPA: putative toxin-antitoxin system toxin component, PIN family [Granulicella sp.]
MRLVFDTNIMVAAFRSHTGASRRLLRYIPQEQFRLVTSPALYLEYETVLTRPEQLSIHGLSSQRIEEFLVYLASFTEKTKIHYSYRPQLRDPNDEMVLEAAVNGHADAIVTYNIRDFLPAAHRFGIEVLTPGRILKERLKI